VKKIKVLAILDVEARERLILALMTNMHNKRKK